MYYNSTSPLFKPLMYPTRVSNSKCITNCISGINSV